MFWKFGDFMNLDPAWIRIRIRIHITAMFSFKDLNEIPCPVVNSRNLVQLYYNVNVYKFILLQSF